MCGRPPAFRKLVLIFSGYALTGRSPKSFRRVVGRPQAFRTSGGKAEKQEWLLAERIMLSHHPDDREKPLTRNGRNHKRVTFFFLRLIDSFQSLNDLHLGLGPFRIL